MFKKAVKSQSKLRLALEGISGSGKTYSALILAESLGQKIAVLDTEHGSASLYAGRFEFDVVNLKPPYSPERYIEIIKGAEADGYDVLIIDSLSHEWFGEGGCLDINTKFGGRFQDWGKVTPRHNALINAILSTPLHIIATMRSKSEYAVEDSVNRAGNKSIKATKVGTAAVQREGMEYEFTMTFALNTNHMATATKDRTGLFDGRDFMITAETGKEILNWLNSGAAPAQGSAPTSATPVNVEQKEKIAELIRDIAPTPAEAKEVKALQYAVNPNLLNGLSEGQGTALIAKLEAYFNEKLNKLAQQQQNVEQPA